MTQDDLFKLAIEGVLDRVTKEARAEAMSKSQLMVGELLAYLKALPGDLLVTWDDGAQIGECSSYRGYYQDLGLETGHLPMTVSSLVNQVKGMLGSTMEGYKGGDFLVSRDTLVWRHEWGTTRNAARVIGVERVGDGVVLQTAVEG